jgi:hypothetical protein
VLIDGEKSGLLSKMEGKICEHEVRVLLPVLCDTTGTAVHYILTLKMATAVVAETVDNFQRLFLLILEGRTCPLAPSAKT